jgi:hypothetical protein
MAGRMENIRIPRIIYEYQPKGRREYMGVHGCN